MAFQSILYSNGKPSFRREAPSFFHDLRIDKIIGELLTGMDEYNLAGFYFTPLDNIADITYRQNVLTDIQIPALSAALKLFAEVMHAVRVLVAENNKFTYAWQQKIYFLEQMGRYCTAVETLTADLIGTNLKSSGLLRFNEYLSNYVKAPAFTAFAGETRKLTADISAVKYEVIMKDLRVQVRDYRDEPDFSNEISRTFGRFKQEPVKDYHSKMENYLEMNHVEASILDGVVTLYGELFQQLETYCVRYNNYLDPVIGDFDREIHFYLNWQQYTAKLTEAGLSFCIPEILTGTKNVSSNNSFDVALAKVLVSKNLPVITNDFQLENSERIIIITGPNQGGKTTFARAFGQLHYLASIGLSVPGNDARMFLHDQIYTHFEKEENIHEHRSKFEDDLYRIHNILAEATPDSIVIFNEILSSTSLEDALLLGKKVMETVDRLDCFCVWITFMDELLTYSPKTVSMVSTIEPDDPTVRTFKIIRKPADGFAYALSIAEKYGVTYTRLKNGFLNESSVTIQRP